MILDHLLELIKAVFNPCGESIGALFERCDGVIVCASYCSGLVEVLKLAIDFFDFCILYMSLLQI